MEMDLNRDEQNYLEKALDHYLMELTGEISSTDNREYRDGLKKEKEILIVLRNKLDRGELNR